jgi:hypothetical protein
MAGEEALKVFEDLQRRGLIWSAEEPGGKVGGSGGTYSCEGRYTIIGNDVAGGHAGLSGVGGAFVQEVLPLFKRGSIHQWEVLNATLVGESSLVLRGLVREVLRQPVGPYLIFLPVICRIVQNFSFQNRDILWIGDLLPPASSIFSYLGSDILDRIVVIDRVNSMSRLSELLDYVLRSRAVGIVVVRLKSLTLLQGRKLVRAVREGGGVCLVVTDSGLSSSGFHSEWRVQAASAHDRNFSGEIRPEFYVKLQKSKGNGYPPRTWRVMCEFEKSLSVNILSQSVG